MLDIANSALLQSGAKRAVKIGQSGLFSFITDQDRFLSLISAVNSRSRVNILATPHVIAADNREAHILIGEEVPILTSTQQSTLATANIVSSIQYRDTGTILTILPQVNSAGLVNMEIRQEVSDVGVASFGETNSPSFTSRETETTVVVRNRESVLLGGIIDERVERIRNGVPFLMDVPVLGRLFRIEQDKRERTELIILITPHVIRDRNEAQAVTQEFTDRVHRLREVIESARQPADQQPPAAQPDAGEE
jgi:general secretion pathway protein D